MIERHLIKRIKPQKAKTPEFYPSAHVDTAHGADNTIGTPLILFFGVANAIRHNRFPSFFLSAPPPFSLCAGNLIYEPAWRLDFPTDGSSQLSRSPRAKRGEADF